MNAPKRPYPHMLNRMVRVFINDVTQEVGGVKCKKMDSVGVSEKAQLCDVIYERSLIPNIMHLMHLNEIVSVKMSVLLHPWNYLVHVVFADC